MSTREEVQSTYAQASEQSLSLQNIGGEIAQLRQQLENIRTAVLAGWGGNGAAVFGMKMDTVNTLLSSLSAETAQASDMIRSAADVYYQTQMEAITIAEQEAAAAAAAEAEAAAQAAAEAQAQASP